VPRSRSPLLLGGLLAVALVGAGLVVWSTVLVPRSQRPGQPGGPAPDFNLPLADGGGSRTLAQQRGKVVLLNFWATWCEPCRAEMPALQRLDQDLRDRPFALYPINLQEDAATVDPYTQQIGFQVPVLLDQEGAVTRAYGVRGLPATFLIDRSGLLREQHLGPLVEGDAGTEWSQAWVAARVQDLLVQ
jgi:cytochrome c biogenesis protein CcmG, thiol:disulfide interchange protein DsbE